MPKELRQFGCARCDSLFWKGVNPASPVARCRRCNTNLRALAREDELGYGKFTCDKCSHEWTNGKAKWSLLQPCYSCRSRGVTTKMKPYSIGPNPHRHERKTDNKHKCEGCPEGRCKHKKFSDPVDVDEVADALNNLAL